MNILENLIIATAGKDGEKVQNRNYTCLHLCYQAGEQGQLESRYSVNNPQNSYMGILESKEQQLLKLPKKFAEDVIYEVHRLHYSGVFADIEDLEQQKNMLPVLDKTLYSENIPLFVPASADKLVKHAIITIETDISGGSLEEYVTGYANQYGMERIAAFIVPVYADYKLPSLKSENTALSPEDIDSLIEKYNVSVFYSSELQCNYFTYMDDKECGHFVIFDNRRTIEKKLEFLTDMGIQKFFMIYPDYVMIFTS